MPGNLVPGNLVPGAAALAQGGTRFFISASRHILGHVGGHFGDTFWSGQGHFLVGSGSLFRDFWDVLGSVWEWSGDVFR